MKTPRCVLVVKMVLVLLPFNLLFMTQSAAVTTVHCVDTSSALDTALKNLAAAPGNQDDDEIRVRTGLYLAPAGGWKATVTSNHDLFIYGGYTDAQCSQRSLDAAATLLDGNNTDTVLRIDSSAIANSRIEISGLTFQHGNGVAGFDSPAGGLKIADPGPIHGGDVVIERNIFRNNLATGTGSLGGGLVACTDGNLVVRNNLFAGNQGPNMAAAFMYSNDAIAFGNNTIEDNSSTDTSLAQRVSVDFFTFGGLKLDNNVFWGNHVGAGIFDINLGGQFHGVTANNNDFESTVGTAVSEKNSLHVDPAFASKVDPRPKWKSPLIDAGVLAPVGGASPVDVHGSARLDGLGMDIGAIETDFIFVDSLE
jgi:hypothetical protein